LYLAIFAYRYLVTTFVRAAILVRVVRAAPRRAHRFVLRYGAQRCCGVVYSSRQIRVVRGTGCRILLFAARCARTRAPCRYHRFVPPVGDSSWAPHDVGIFVGISLRTRL